MVTDGQFKIPNNILIGQDRNKCRIIYKALVTKEVDSEHMATEI